MTAMLIEFTWFRWESGDIYMRQNKTSKVLSKLNKRNLSSEYKYIDQFALHCHFRGFSHVFLFGVTFFTLVFCHSISAILNLRLKSCSSSLTCRNSMFQCIFRPKPACFFYFKKNAILFVKCWFLSKDKRNSIL